MIPLKVPTVFLISSFLSHSSAFISRRECILAAGGGVKCTKHQICLDTYIYKTAWRGSLSVCLKGERRGEGRNTGLGLKVRLHEEGEKPCRTEAKAAPPPNSRLTFRVRYLTQLHSSLPAPHLSFLPPPFLSLGTPPPTTLLSPSFLSALFPLHKHAS